MYGVVSIMSSLNSIARRGGEGVVYKQSFHLKYTFGNRKERGVLFWYNCFG